MAIQVTQGFEVITCCRCKIQFAVAAAVKAELLDSGDDFFCPNGHRQHFCESTESKLEKERKERERLRAHLENERRRNEEEEERLKRTLAAERAAKTRYKNKLQGTDTDEDGQDTDN